MARNHPNVSSEVAVELVDLARQMRRLLFGSDGGPEWGRSFRRLRRSLWKWGGSCRG